MKLKSPEMIFVILAFVFGCVFLFITPFNEVPDEQAHLMRACEVADGILYGKNTPILTTKCDELIKRDILLTRPKDAFYGASGYSPILYTFPALGLKLGEVWGGKTMFYFARLFNLFAFILLTAWAIRITPVFKYQFLIVALLPMTLYEGMSISADSINNAVAFLFFAYLFKLIFSNKNNLSPKELVSLVALSSLGAMLKGLVYPIFLFIFLPIQRNKNIFIMLCLIIAVGIMCCWSAINPVFTYPDPLMSASFNKYVLLHNPLNFLCKFINTLIYRGYWYIPSCIGVLGLLKVLLYPAYFIEPILFISSFFVFPTNVSKNNRIVALLIFVAFTVFMHIMFYINWTLPSSSRIEGVQGRYFIPMLPLLFLVFAQNKIKISSQNQNKYILILIFAIFITLVYSVFALHNYFM